MPVSMAGSTPVTGPLHENEITIEPELVQSLLDSQFPEYADLPIRPLPPSGTDNRLFRLGDQLVVRMPRIDWAAESAAFEATWLPRLAPYLPLPIPVPVGLGQPAQGYPWSFTIVPWIEGENPDPDGSTLDPEEWAATLGDFVRDLQAAPAMDAPVMQEGRGAPLPLLDDWVQEWTAKAVETFGIDADPVLALWADALDAPPWEGEPRWLHADLHEGNLLARDGHLTAVIDWGAAGRGDPAAELNAAWGYLPAGVEQVFVDAVGLDEAAWRRARGYALAPSISGAVYYRETAPEESRGSLEKVQRLIASLD
jgi:aminoglycoside phosphotransferase (APT) family kinase protein